MLTDVPFWCTPVQLPATGASNMLLIVGAALFLVVGVGLALLARRGAAIALALVFVVGGAVTVGSHSADAAGEYDCPPGYVWSGVTTTTAGPTTTSTAPETTTTTSTTSTTLAPQTADVTYYDLAVYSGNFDGQVDDNDQPLGYGENSDTLSIKQFDPTLGELVSVHVELQTAYGGANYRIINEGSNSPLVTTFTIKQDIVFTGLPGFPAATWFTEDKSLVNLNLPAGDSWTAMLAPGKFYGTPDFSADFSGGDLAQFIGAATIDSTVTNTLYFSIPNPPPPQLVRNPRGGQASVEVTYTYIPA